MSKPKDDAIWRPQPGPQHAFVKAGRIDEVFFGGARGGGKTDAMLGDFALHGLRYKRVARGIVFRRQLTQLEDMIDRSKEIYVPLGAVWKEQKKLWIFPEGATLRFRALERDKDAEKYQGHQYTRIYFEELTNFPSPGPYLKMFGVLRSAHGVPCGIRATGNPGGPGHNWVKARFIDVAAPMTLICERIDNLIFRRVYIPSRLKDNPKLLERDPLYIARLKQTGHADLVRAWLEGDWDVIAGGMFDDLWRRDTHVIKPFEIPESWPIYRGFDWGSSKPFAVQWWAESDGTGRIEWPRSTAFLIAQWYGSNGQPNEGLRLSDVEIARGIIEREKTLGIADRVQAGPADASIFARDNNDDCPADAMDNEGVGFIPSDKSPGSRVRGVEIIRRRLAASRETPIESPGMCVFDRCTDFVRTFPVLPRCPRNPDDVDTEAEDHDFDTARYMLTWMRPMDEPVSGGYAAV